MFNTLIIYSKKNLKNGQKVFHQLDNQSCIKIPILTRFYFTHKPICPFGPLVDPFFGMEVFIHLCDYFYREAKKDQAVEQAHNLLTTIHESFEEITEKILATDRARREATDLETKLSSVTARSLNIDKLQADLDAIRKENEYLQRRLSNS